MLEKITIKNFKSIYNDTIDLGRVNVFIGENGCGKSNILEAVAFAGALKNNKTVDSEILFSKGVRIAKPDLMRSSFLGKKSLQIIQHLSVYLLQKTKKILIQYGKIKMKIYK